MAILGNNAAAGVDTTSFAVGRLWAAKFLAGEAGTITALHGWYNAVQEPVTMAAYGPSGLNQPGARLGYGDFDPGLFSGVVEAVASGLSIPFSAGVVWLGFTPCAASGGQWLETDGGGVSGDYQGIASAKLAGAAPSCVPADPFPTIDFGPEDRNFNIWAVYTPETPAASVNLLAPPTIRGRGAA